MGMGDRNPMTTDLDILTLTQWFSPGFPVGAFAYSHGLEWAIDTRQVTDASSTQEWISDVLCHGSGRNDCLFLAAAYRARDPDDLATIDARCRAFAPSPERLKETDLQGDAFCTVTSAVWSAASAKLTYPVAVGWMARQQNLPLDLTARMYLHSFISNLVSVAMRLVPLGQTDGQRLIHGLAPVVADVASDALNAELEDLGSTTFLSDIASMKHETQYSRIFRT